MSTTPNLPALNDKKDTTKDRLTAVRRVHITLSKLSPEDAISVIESVRAVYVTQAKQ